MFVLKALKANKQKPKLSQPFRGGNVQALHYAIAIEVLGENN